ncbi:MAG: AI-2E family transporter [Chloroflexota bacterium]
MADDAEREQRWRFGFFVLGAIYIGLLVVDFLVNRVLAGFTQIGLVIFLAWLLAFVLSPLVDLAGRRLHVGRGAAAAIVYAGALLVGGSVLIYSLTVSAAQVGQLADTFPQTRLTIQATLRGWQNGLSLGPFAPDLVQLFADVERTVTDAGTSMLTKAPGVTLSVVGALLLVIILSLYMVADADRIMAKFNRVIPTRYEEHMEIFERTVGRAFGGFLRAQVILAAIQAALTLAVAVIAGLPFAFLVVAASALAMLIPFFGPPLALLPPIVATAVYAPGWLLVVAPLLLISQTVIVNYLQPRLMREALGMHPLLVLVGLLVGAQVAGVWGALFGIPILAVANVLFNYLINLRTIEEIPEVDTEAILEEVRRESPNASPEALMALAAERAEEVHEDAQEEALEDATKQAAKEA